jgi:hypothetical protein
MQTDFSLYNNADLILAHKVLSECLRVNEVLLEIPTEIDKAARPEFINAWKNDFVLVERELLARLTQFDDVCNELTHVPATDEREGYFKWISIGEARRLIADEVHDGIVSQSHGPLRTS